MLEAKLQKLTELKALRAELEQRARVADAARRPDPNRFATPGALARHMDAKTVQTGALDLLDASLVDVAEGNCPRLIWSMPPQEGKVNGPAAGSLYGCWSAIPTFG